MKQNDDKMIMSKAYEVFNVMEKRVSETDMIRIREAFEFAREAHAGQKRKSGEPYIIHPIAVACIVAKELELGANPPDFITHPRHQVAQLENQAVAKI